MLLQIYLLLLEQYTSSFYRTSVFPYWHFCTNACQFF